MPHYMLLLYSEPAEGEEQARREAELPLWAQLNDSLREAGLLLANDRLHDVSAATSVRVRGERAEITDGPFAVTKERLAGYYVLDCRDLDQALEIAQRLPLARYGTVEVRPVMDGGAVMERFAEATAGS